MFTHLAHTGFLGTFAYWVYWWKLKELREHRGARDTERLYFHSFCLFRQTEETNKRSLDSALRVLPPAVLLTAGNISGLFPWKYYTVTFCWIPRWHWGERAKPFLWTQGMWAPSSWSKQKNDSSLLPGLSSLVLLLVFTGHVPGLGQNRKRPRWLWWREPETGSLFWSKGNTSNWCTVFQELLTVAWGATGVLFSWKRGWWEWLGERQTLCISSDIN